MTTATAYDSTGAAFEVSNLVLDSTGTGFEVSDFAYNSAGLPFQVFGDVLIPVKDDDVGGSKRKYRKPRFNVGQLRHEDELILSMIRRFMDRM